MRIFASGDEVVRFEPVGPEDEAAAAQATDYVNWIWNQQNDGFSIFHSWFKDALLKTDAQLQAAWQAAGLGVAAADRRWEATGKEVQPGS
jgi:hypothetical protein